MFRAVRNAYAYDYHIEILEFIKDVVDGFLLHEEVQDLPVGKDRRRKELGICAPKLIREFSCQLVALHVRAVDRDAADASLQGDEQQVLMLIVGLVGAHDIVERIAHGHAYLVAFLEEAVQIVRRGSEHV